MSALSTILDWLGFGASGHAQRHAGHDAGVHGHTHGLIDPSLTTSERGIWAIKWSFVILAITAGLQLAVVAISGSVALLADTIHNFGDATTAIPLWVAFVLVRRKPSTTFTYGFGRVEDLAGILIVLIILASAIVAAYEAIDRLVHPQPVTQLGWLVAAGVVGFVGNEAVAVFRIRVGRQMNSAALIADGYHARTDGLTSLAVVAGAAGVWLGYPLSDPIIGLLITVAIFGIVWQSARAVLTRSLDGLEPGITEEIRHAAGHVRGVEGIEGVRARWVGHKLLAELTIAVQPTLSVAAAGEVAAALESELKAHLPALAEARIQFSRSEGSARPGGESHHHAPEPFRFIGGIASGLLSIVDAPGGERLRLTIDGDVDGLSAVVLIRREGGRIEEHALAFAPDNPHYLESPETLAEPHEFAADLRLRAGFETEVLPFRMSEPEEHRR